MPTKEDVTKLITEFRAIVDKNVISPDSLGNILQQILNVTPQQSEGQEGSECSCENKYAEFARMLSEDMEPNLETLGALQEGKVVFCPKYGTFIYEVRVNAIKPTYYGTWFGWKDYGSEQDRNGTIPDEGRLYCDTSANTLYRWSGSEMVAVGKAGSVSSENCADANSAGLMSADDFKRLHRLSLLGFDYYFESQDHLNHSEISFKKGDIAYIHGSKGYFKEYDGSTWEDMPNGEYNSTENLLNGSANPLKLFICEGKVYRAAVHQINPGAKYMTSNLQIAFMAANEIDQLNLNFSTLQESITGWLATKQDSVQVVRIEASDFIDVYPGNCFLVSRQLDGQVQINITSDGEGDCAAGFSMFFKTGNDPQISFSAESESPIMKSEGFSIEPNSSCELNFRFNGEVWIVSSSTLK